MTWEYVRNLLKALDVAKNALGRYSDMSAEYFDGHDGGELAANTLETMDIILRSEDK